MFQPPNLQKLEINTFAHKLPWKHSAVFIDLKIGNAGSFSFSPRSPAPQTCKSRQSPKAATGLPACLPTQPSTHLLTSLTTTPARLPDRLAKSHHTGYSFIFNLRSFLNLRTVHFQTRTTNFDILKT